MSHKFRFGKQKLLKTNQKEITMNDKKFSFLIIDVTECLGDYIIQALSMHDAYSKPQIFGLFLDPLKLDSKTETLCEDVIQGDPSQEDTIVKALEKSNPDVIILYIGNQNDDGSAYSSRRAAKSTPTAAKTLASVLLAAPQYHHIRVLVLSRLGAGGFRPKLGYGRGLIHSTRARRLLHDHRQQEAIFWCSNELRKRTTILRLTKLVDDHRLKDRRIYSFDDFTKPPTQKIDRSDLADWIADQLCHNQLKYLGGVVTNLTTVEANYTPGILSRLV